LADSFLLYDNLGYKLIHVKVLLLDKEEKIKIYSYFIKASSLLIAVNENESCGHSWRQDEVSMLGHVVPGWVTTSQSGHPTVEDRA
jgi:hypothetical protein